MDGSLSSVASSLPSETHGQRNPKIYGVGYGLIQKGNIISLSSRGISQATAPQSVNSKGYSYRRILGRGIVPFITKFRNYVIFEVIIIQMNYGYRERKETITLRLSQDKVVTELQHMPGWEWVSPGAIRKEFVFADFTGSVQFVGRTVHPANAMGHHPDIDIRYNRVLITLTTHDEGGVTAKDLELAQKLDLLE